MERISSQAIQTYDFAIAERYKDLTTHFWKDLCIRGNPLTFRGLSNEVLNQRGS